MCISGELRGLEENPQTFRCCPCFHLEPANAFLRAPAALALVCWGVPAGSRHCGPRQKHTQGQGRNWNLMLPNFIIPLGLFVWHLKNTGLRQLPCRLVHLCRGANDRLITFQYFNFLKRMVSQRVYLSQISHSLIHFVPCNDGD